MSSDRAQARRRDPAPIFAALGDETRLSLLAKLSDGQSRSIAKLSADTALTRQAITKHLRVLENARAASGPAGKADTPCAPSRSPRRDPISTRFQSNGTMLCRVSAPW